MNKHEEDKAVSCFIDRYFVCSYFFKIHFLQYSGATGGEWKAPGEAQKLKNPVAQNTASLQKGKELYNLYCSSCHGEVGFGDGAARGPLGIKPANFHDEKIKKQDDGELFWKLTNGRKDMPAFEKILTEDQRWHVVSYLRNIPDKPELKTTSCSAPGYKSGAFYDY